MTSRALQGFLCCFAGGDQYALRGGDVSVVARAEQMVAAAAPGDVIGTLPRRGGGIPVYSLTALLGGALDTRTVDRHIIVTGSAQHPFGLLVDRIVRAPGAGAEVLSLPPVVGGAAARWFDGLLRLQETSCLVLDPAGLNPAGPGPARGAAPTPPVGRRPGPEVRDLMLAFSSPALPALAVDRFAVGAARVNAVTQSISLVSLPGSQRHVAALGAWRRSAVAVLDFSPGRTVTAASRRFLVMRCDDGGLVAVAVDGDTVLRRATSQDVRASTTSSPDYVRGVFRSSGECIALLDVDRLAAG